MKETLQETMDRLGGVGAEVNVEAKPDSDFNHNFTGYIVGIHGNCITVKDQEDDAWDCDPDQLSACSDNTMH